MNTNKRLNWSEIEITGDDTGDKETFKVNLNNEELDDDGDKAPQDTRRSNFTVSKNTNEDKENKDNKTRTQVEEDQEERAFSNKQTRQTPVTNDEDEGEDGNETPRKGGRAQRRIQNLTRVKNEYETIIQRQARELQELKARTRETEKRSAVAQRDAYKQALEDTEEQLKQALETNDTAKVAKLTKQLADQTMRANAFTAVAEELENYEEPQEEQRGPQTPPEVPEEAKSWIKRNPWFFQDEKKHVLARMISREITNEGVYDPNDEEYWQELDKRLGDYGVKAQNSKENQEDTTPVKKQTSRKGPVSSSRNDEDGGSYDFSSDPQFKRQGNRVTANPTQSDREMAERLGVKIEDLMKEKYKYAQQGYSGYVPIDVP